MIFQRSCVLVIVALSTAAKAANHHLRLSNTDLSDPTDPTCTIRGSTGEDACDESTAADGSACVWCSISSYGFCVDQDQAEMIEEKIPMADCGGGGDNDDAIADDDATDDDDTPADYWTCLKSTSDADSCAAKGCTWCDTKGGYGICMDSKAAESAATSDWFTCATTSEENVVVSDPFDTTCLAMTVQMDHDACVATKDVDGQPCAWCTVGSTPLCLDSEQAEIAAQLGGSCDASVELADPFDTTCLAASIEMDEASCKATTDEDGNPCEWCTVGGTPLCLNDEQADIAAQLGGSCDDAVKLEVSDPYDTTCLAATLMGDEDTCLSTKDADGQACQWCSVGTVQMCLNSEQGDIASQLGGSCDATDSSTVSDPFDTTCLAETMQMDKDACLATKDAAGEACEWCTVGASQFCLNEEQADIATQIGGNCDAAAVVLSDKMGSVME